MFLCYIEDKKPDVLIINEMIISPLEKIDFISKIKDQGFSCFEENIPKGKFSFTEILSVPCQYLRIKGIVKIDQFYILFLELILMESISHRRAMRSF